MRAMAVFWSWIPDSYFFGNTYKNQEKFPVKTEVNLAQ